MALVELDAREMEGHLPAICMRCGSPATEWVERRFELPEAERSPIFIPFVGRLIELVRLGQSFFRDSVGLRAPFCRAHRRHWFWRRVIIAGGLALCLILLAGGYCKQVEAFYAAMAVLALWATGTVIAHETSIKAKSITKDCLSLTGVADSFVDALEEHRKRGRWG